MSSIALCQCMVPHVVIALCQYFHDYLLRWL